MKTFVTAKYDVLTLLLTILSAVLLPLFIVYVQRNSGDGNYFLIGFLVFWVVLCVFCWLHRPTFYVSERALTIKNTFRTVEIPWDVMAGVRREPVRTFNVRLWGIGGLFGYYGIFNSNQQWWVTNTNKKICLQLKSGRQYIISPQDEGEVLRLINQKIHQF